MWPRPAPPPESWSGRGYTNRKAEMVKVFPNNFSFVEKQRLLTSVPSEPVAIACSDDCLFVAEEGCLLEVFSLTGSLQLLGQFRTVSTAKELVYNRKGDCIVTLERKSAVSHGFARVYFKWRGASVDKPMRISLLHSFSHAQGMRPPQDHVSAEIIELPGELNSPVTCLACCPESGRIAVGMDTTLRIFSLTAEEGVSSEEAEGSGMSHDSASPVSHSIDILMDIHTNTALHKLSIFSDYVAFISTHEVRVLKLSLLRDHDLQTQQLPFAMTTDVSFSSSCSSPSSSSPLATAAQPSQRHQPQVESILEDKDFVKWSPSRVWEEEKAVNSSPASTNSSLVDVSLPLLSLDRTKSRDSRGPSPIIGTLSLPSVCCSTSLRTMDRHAMEVLGPAEYIWGHPITVNIEDSAGNDTPTQCRVLTMLYRRFPIVRGGSTIGEFSLRSATTVPSKGKGRGQRSEQEEGEQIGLHTVQLLPIIITDDDGGRQLIGISCFLADKFHGYLYDVHLRGHLATSFSFMSPTRAVVCDHRFLHALSAESVETYTNRSLQAAILHFPVDHLDTHSEWLRKPCPPPSMDLTLVSANQFVSSYCLASSKNFMVVLTKSSEHAQSTAKWLLSSLTPKKTTEMSWNIYVLEKEDTVSMYQQFGELSNSLQDTSPPMYHHLLCEGHNLLRSELLLNSDLSPQHSKSIASSLRESCLAVAESLCCYNNGKTDITAAAKYLLISQEKIWSIIQIILKKFPRNPSSLAPYNILMKYLDLVLFDKKFSSIYGEGGQEAADTILQLYADLRPQQLPKVFLKSWIDQHYSLGKGLQVISSFLDDKSLTVSQIFLGRLCELLFLLRLNRSQEAIEKLKELTDTFFVEWLGNNLHYLVEDGCHLSKLGKLLLENRESCLLEVFYHSLTSREFGLDLICTLLQGSSAQSSSSEEQLAVNLPLKHFLDGIFLDKVKGLSPDAMPRARILLVDVLLARLTAATPSPSSSTPFSLYGSRFKWLDSLPPFDAPSLHHSQAMQVALQDLMQLQALLCNAHLTSSHVTSPNDHMTAVAHHLEECMVEGMLGHLSLLLLTWPHTGKIEQAIKLVFDQQPSLTVEYCESFLPPQLHHWKPLLDLLLDRCNESSDVAPPPSLLSSSADDTSHHSPEPDPLQTHITLYKAALGHVVSLCSPEELLDLIPASGTISFFLPFIEKSCKLHLSRQLAHHISIVPTQTADKI